MYYLFLRRIYERISTILYRQQFNATIYQATVRSGYPIFFPWSVLSRAIYVVQLWHNKFPYKELYKWKKKTLKYVRQMHTCTHIYKHTRKFWRTLNSYIVSRSTPQKVKSFLCCYSAFREGPDFRAFRLSGSFIIYRKLSSKDCKLIEKKIIFCWQVVNPSNLFYIFIIQSSLTNVFVLPKRL